jgi:hypothetical protein
VNFVSDPATASRSNPMRVSFESIGFGALIALVVRARVGPSAAAS